MKRTTSRALAAEAGRRTRYTAFVVKGLLQRAVGHCTLQKRWQTSKMQTQAHIEEQVVEVEEEEERSSMDSSHSMLVHFDSRDIGLYNLARKRISNRSSSSTTATAAAAGHEPFSCPCGCTEE